MNLKLNKITSLFVSIITSILVLLYIVGCDSSLKTKSANNPVVENLSCTPENVTTLNQDISVSGSSFVQYQSSTKLKTAVFSGLGSPTFKDQKSYIFDKTYAAGVFYFLSNESTGNFIFKFNQNTNALTQVSSTSLILDVGNISHVVYNGILYFAADDGASGLELWKLNLSTDVLSLASDVLAGANGSYVRNLQLYNNKIYFSATTNGSDYNLKSFNPVNSAVTTHAGSYASGGPRDLTVYSSAIYFSDSGGPGSQIFKYDSVTNMVTLVGTVPGQFPSITTPLAVYDGLIYFGSQDQMAGNELYKYSSVTNIISRVVDKVAGSGSFSPNNLFVFNQKLYMSGQDGVPQVTGNELWVYTTASNQINLVSDFYPGLRSGSTEYANSSNPSFFTEYNGKIYFYALTTAGARVMQMTTNQTITELASFQYQTRYPIHIFGSKLYYLEDSLSLQSRLRSYDFSTQVTNQDPILGTPASISLSPTSHVLTGSDIYMASYISGRGVELLKYNITTDRVSLVADIYTGSSSSQPYNLKLIGTSLYFSADDGIHGFEIYKYETTNGTLTRLCDINNSTSSSSPSNFVVFDNQLFFSAEPNVGNSIDNLIGFDLSENKFNLYKINGANIEYPDDLFVSGNRLYFTTQINSVDQSYYYDSTNSQMTLAEENKFPYFNGQILDDYAFLNNKYYFNFGDDATGAELWVYNPQTQISNMALDFYVGMNGVSPENMSAAGTKIYFGGSFTAAGREPGVFDPATNMISMLSNLVSGTGSSNPSGFTLAHNKVYFVATTNVGSELYVYDPAGPSTLLVYDIESGAQSSDPKLLVSNGTYLYFIANGYLFRAQQ